MVRYGTGYVPYHRPRCHRGRAGRAELPTSAVRSCLLWLLSTRHSSRRDSSSPMESVSQGLMGHVPVQQQRRYRYKHHDRQHRQKAPHRDQAFCLQPRPTYIEQRQSLSQDKQFMSASVYTSHKHGSMAKSFFHPDYVPTEQGSLGELVEDMEVVTRNEDGGE